MSSSCGPVQYRLARSVAPKALPNVIPGLCRRALLFQAPSQGVEKDAIFPLKCQLECQLHTPWIVQDIVGPRQLTEIRILQLIRPGAEAHAVEEIKCLATEIDPQPFANRKRLDD